MKQRPTVKLNFEDQLRLVFPKTMPCLNSCFPVHSYSLHNTTRLKIHDTPCRPTLSFMVLIMPLENAIVDLPMVVFPRIFIGKC